MSEDVLIPVVDENDSVITYIKRNDKRQSGFYRASYLWVINDSGHVLLAQRSRLKRNYPSVWGTAVAGTVEGNETYQETIMREAYEELGLDHISPQFLCKYIFNNESMATIFTVVVNRKVEEFRCQKGEVEAVTWMPYDMLLQDVAARPEQYVPEFSNYIQYFKNFHLER